MTTLHSAGFVLVKNSTTDYHSFTVPRAQPHADDGQSACIPQHTFEKHEFNRVLSFSPRVEHLAMLWICEVTGVSPPRPLIPKSRVIALLKEQQKAKARARAHTNFII